MFGAGIPSSPKLGPILVVPQLLFLSDYLVCTDVISQEYDSDLARSMPDKSSLGLSPAEISDYLETPAYATSPSPSGSPSFSRGRGKLSKAMAQKKAAVTLGVAQALYDTAPHLFATDWDGDFVRLIIDEANRAQVVDNISVLDHVHPRMTVPARRDIPAKSTLKDFEWQQWLLEGIRRERFRTLIQLDADAAHFKRIQKLLHERLWQNAMFQQFLNRWLFPNDFKEMLRELTISQPHEFISRFWAEYYAPSLNPDGVVIHSGGGLFRRLLHAVTVRRYASALRKTRTAVRETVLSIEPGGSIFAFLDDHFAQAGDVAEKDILAIRGHHRAAIALGLSPIDTDDLAHSAATETAVFAAVLDSNDPKYADDSDDPEEMATQDGLLPVDEPEDGMDTQDPFVLDDADADDLDFDAVPTMMDSNTVPLEPATAPVAVEKAPAPPTNPYRQVKEHAIHLLGDDVEHIRMADLTRIKVGSFVQFHINYKDFYYTLEKVSERTFRMWSKKSDCAQSGRPSELIEFDDSGTLAIGQSLTLAKPEPDRELEQDRWPTNGIPPFVTMIRCFSKDVLKNARRKSAPVDKLAKQPRLFFLSKQMCRFAIDGTGLTVGTLDRVWHFSDVTEGKRILLGRMPNNDIHLKGVGGISRRHCAIVPEGGQWFLADLDSTNGCFYAGQQLKSGTKNKRNWIKLPEGSRQQDNKIVGKRMT